jgi:hypothetical protein
MPEIFLDTQYREDDTRITSPAALSGSVAALSAELTPGNTSPHLVIEPPARPHVLHKGNGNLP